MVPEMNTRQKLTLLKTWLKSKVFDRDMVIDDMFLAMVAGEHVCTIGAPGSGKSYTVDLLASALVEDLDPKVKAYFEALFSPYIKPEEIFGPVNVKTFTEEQRVERKVDNFLPNCRVAFLDEIWKAVTFNNTMLKVLNERKYSQDGVFTTIPLWFAFAASNEYPQDPTLGALWDRFLFRQEVGYIADEVTELDFIMSDDEKPTPPVTIKTSELYQARLETKAVTFTVETGKMLQKICRNLLRQGVVVSDRRKKAVKKAIRAAAWFDGRTETVPEDCEVIASCIWNDRKEIKIVRQVVLKMANDQLDSIMTFLDLNTSMVEEWKAAGANGSPNKTLTDLLKNQALLLALQVKPKNKPAFDRASKAIQGTIDFMSHLATEETARINAGV